ncbi:CHAT domain-containing protein [Hyalangium rubrum]|uniref:CHAT domain-containing protein n=1 Tax=Hyalangium rubrum TaxID=3103134 RepID=A0ABU5H5I3_9BACT|nr:CHAT domain-containing protein [Hyalangium sp. s54d21]MDY7228723.1 CHAT domain-containing protein [Hyalangium sp. s54d21]
MTRPCDQVELFVDGELPLEEADAFRFHLPDCPRCQREMSNLMQLRLLGNRYVEREGTREVDAVPRPPVRARWMRPLLMASASLAAALVVLVAVRQGSKPSFESDVWLLERPRLLEARVSYRDADRYRSMESRSMGSKGASARLPHGDLGILEERDPRGLVAAYLVRGEPGLVELALQELDKLDEAPEPRDSSDLASDRAVAMWLKGNHEEALRLLDAALEKNPRHAQALWNRGLVLRDLHLPLLAAQAFSEVAALNEEGWSGEAAKNAQDLREEQTKRYTRWNEGVEAGKALVNEAPDSLPTGFGQSPDTRRFFYDAVRSAPNRERVLALLPLAQVLDERAGGSVLEGYVRRVAEADFSRRGPLAQDYAALVQGHLKGEARERFLSKLLESKEDDILLGAFFDQGTAAHHLKRHEAIVAANPDPWFHLLLAHARAKLDRAQGRWTNATQVLLDARDRCPKPGLEYPCIYTKLDLSSLYIRLNQFEIARTHVEDGLKEARGSNAWKMESSLLWNLAQIARVRGEDSLARAYLKEFLERELLKGAQKDADTLRRVHQELAAIAIRQLRVDEARREIDAAIDAASAVGETLSLPGSFDLADISRRKPAANDEQHLTKAVEKLQKGLSPGERLVAKHVLGRFYIERDVEKGSSLLRDLIQEAEAPQLREDGAARRARAYSFTSLLHEAGKRNAFEEALKLFAQEWGGELPRQCLLAVTADSGRLLLVARGVDGALEGRHQELGKPLPVRLDKTVPEELKGLLRACPQVQVLARPPIHGRAGLLPPEMAWSYLTRTPAPRPQRTGPAIHLVVSNVELPRDVPFKRLNPWRPTFGPNEQRRELSGAEATPSRVLEAMRDATEIDLVAHGTINESTNASYLLLASEPDGPELGVAEVRAASLQGSPFVVLAACHAAHTASSFDSPFSLPAAFIEAGARGVLASTVEIPDQEAEKFFNAVRERMRSGTSPVQALREERLKWLSAGQGTQWLDSVLLFE